MSISSVVPPAGQRAGNGTTVYFNTSVSLAPGYWFKVLITTGTGYTLTSGVKVWDGVSSPNVILGYGDGSDGNPVGVWGSMAVELMAGKADNASVTAFLSVFNAAGALQDSASLAWLWDAVSNLPGLLAPWIGLGAWTPAQQAEVDAIRDAVIRVYS